MFQWAWNLLGWEDGDRETLKSELKQLRKEFERSEAELRKQRFDQFKRELNKTLESRRYQ